MKKIHEILKIDGKEYYFLSRKEKAEKIFSFLRNDFLANFAGYDSIGC